MNFIRRYNYAVMVIVNVACVCAPSVAQNLDGVAKDETHWKTLPYMRETSGVGDLKHPELELASDCRRLFNEFESRSNLGVQRVETAAVLMSALDKLATEYPDVRAGVQARFWKADVFRICNERTKAVAELKIIAEKYAEYPEGLDARVRCAEQYLATGSADEATKLLEPVRDAGQGMTTGPLVELRYEMLRRLAEAYFRMGNRPSFEGTMATIKQEYPKKADEISKWQARYLESKNEDVWAQHELERLASPEKVQQAIDKSFTPDQATRSPGQAARISGEVHSTGVAASGTQRSDGSCVAAIPENGVRQSGRISTKVWWGVAVGILVGGAYGALRVVKRLKTRKCKTQDDLTRAGKVF